MHRSDIDGLRALAVLSVVFFHLGFSEHIDGGFVGVDVFFVISGYLITGIVQAEVAAGHFSLVGFYHRRVRRIFPALFLVHTFCLIASAVLLFPAESKQVGRDVLPRAGRSWPQRLRLRSCLTATLSSLSATNRTVSACAGRSASLPWARG